MDSKHYTVEFENDQVRVVRIRYGPGEKSEMHEHPDGVGFILTGGRARFHYEDGTTEEISWEAGDTMWFPASRHNPENLSDGPIELVQVELKS